MTTSSWSPNRLYRDPDHAMLMGVCAGIADYFGLPRWLVRVGMVILLFTFHFFAVAGYVAMGFFLKPKPADLYKSAEEEEFWRRTRVDPKRTVADVQSKYRDIERRIRDAEAFVTSSEFKLRRDFRKL
jgi:phage shock protein C